MGTGELKIKATGVTSHRGVVSNLIYLALLKLSDYLVPLVAVPFLVRTVGLEGFGVLAYATAAAMIGAAITQYGFGISATRDIARASDDTAEVSRIASATLGASVLLGIVVAVLFSGIEVQFELFEENRAVFFGALFLALVQSVFPTWLFHGVGQFRRVTVTSVASKLIYLSLLVALVHDRSDLALVPLLNAIPVLASLVYAVVLASKLTGIRLHVPPGRDVLSTLKSGRHEFLSQFAPNLYNSATVFILGSTAPPQVTGAFSAASRLIDALNAVAHLIGSAFLPKLSRDLTSHHWYSLMMIGLASVLCGSVAFFAEDIVQILYSSPDPVTTTSLRWLALSSVGTFLLVAYGNNFLLLNGGARFYRNVVLAVSIGSFVIALFAVPKYGVNAALAVIVGARAISAAVVAVRAVKWRGA